MKYDLKELINMIISKSEEIEYEMKNNSELKELTIKQIQVIELIGEIHNPTPTELAEKLDITKPSTTAFIDKLVLNGYVERVKSDTDRRAAHIHLTNKGDKVIELHENVHHAFSDLLTENLTESEKDILVVLLNKAIINL